MYDEALMRRVSELTAGPAIHGTEANIIQSIREAFATPHHDPGFRYVEGDTVVYEMSLKYGRADIVIFHVDGSATVVEVKDGSKGYSHVVAGIGQASLYASQIASTNSVRFVCKALLWTSVGSVAGDSAIVSTCTTARTLAMPWQSMQSLRAIRTAVIERVTGVKYAGR